MATLEYSSDEIYRKARKAFEAKDYKKAKILDGMYQKAYAAEEANAKDGAFEGFGDAFMRGIDQAAENTATTARVFGKDDLADSLGGLVDRRPGQSAASQFMNEGRPIYDFTYAPKAVAEQAGQFIGSLGSRAGGAAVGAGVGGLAGSVIPGAGTAAGAATGGVIGAFGGPMVFEGMQQLGPIAMERAKNNGRKEPNKEDFYVAATSAAGIGMLNAIAPGMSGIMRRMLAEGGTEALQSVGEQTGSTLLTKKGLEVSPRQAIGEGIIGAGSAGAVDTTIAGARKAVGSRTRGQSSAEDLMKGYQEEFPTSRTEQAAADLSKRLALKIDQADEDENSENYDVQDVDPDNNKGAKGLIDNSHSDMNQRLKTLIGMLKERLKIKKSDTFDQVIEKSDAALAAIKSKNKVKNVVEPADFAAFEKIAGDTQEGQEAISLMHEMNALTNLYSGGLTGGVTQYTDALNPIGPLDNYSNTGGPMQQFARPLASIALGLSNPALSAAQIGTFGAGRLIDKATGRRSNVARYIDQNVNQPGQPAATGRSLKNEEAAEEAAKAQVAEQALAQAEEARLRQEQYTEEERQANLRRVQQSAPPQQGSPEDIMRDATGLDRSGLAQVIRILKANPNTLPATTRAIEAYETSVATGGQVDFGLYRDINALVDQYPQLQKLMVRPRNAQSAAQGQAQQQLSQKDQNYQRGIENNRAEAARITEAVKADTTISAQNKAMLLNTLKEMQLDLGLNPVSRLQSMARRLEEKGVPGPTVEKYLGQYLQRVMAQQGAKAERDAAQDDAMEIDESREPLFSLADKSQAALEAWNKNSGDDSLRKAYIKARRERDDAGEFGEEITTEYRMQHQAPVSEDDASMHDLEKSMPDFYKRPRDYRTGSKLDGQTLDILRRVKDDPDQQVKVYRAVPINASNTINYGDWVTVNKQYAEDHGAGMPEGFKVIEGAAPAKDLKTNGDSIHEFGYAARPTKIVALYHSTNEDFEEFDTEKSADGTIWFSDNLSLVEGGYDGASGNALVVTRYIDESKLALASRSQEDKLTHSQLQSMGYDGVKYTGSKDNVYQIYDPSKLQTTEVNLSTLPGALTQPESPQIPFDFTTPTVGQIKDKLEDAKGAVQMVIGKPGTKFEKGLSSYQDYKELADLLDVSIGVYDSQKEFMKDYAVGEATIGVFGADEGGVSGQVGLMRGNKEQDFIQTLAHEMSHSLESRPQSNQESPLVQNRKLSQRHEKAAADKKSSVYLGSLRSKMRKEIFNETPVKDEIEVLQDGTVVSIASRPDLPGRPIRFNVENTIDMYSASNPDATVAQMFSDVVPQFRQYQSYIKGDAEFAVDPVMYYLINPKAMKKDMPNTFKFIQKHFNESNIPVKFFASPLATIVAILMAGMIGGEEEENPGILTPRPGMLSA